MFCPKCGRNYDQHARFCPGCGAPNRSLSKPSEPAPVAPPIEALPDEAPPVESIVQPVEPKPPPAEPAPAPVMVEEEEIAPPPPPSGMVFKFEASPRDRVEPVPEKAASAPAPDSAPQAKPDGQTFAMSGLDLSTNDCALPAQPPVWGFRNAMTSLADKLAGKIPAGGTGTSPQVIDCLRRIVRGALMHKDVYRDAAARGALTQETVWVAVALLFIANIGSLLGGAAMFIIKMMVLEAAGWIGAVLGVHFLAKLQLKLDLPPLAWFRAMIYAQAALVLGIVPALGVLAAGWAVVCTFAALMDVSGKDMKGAGLLFVAAIIANEVVSSVLKPVLF